MAQYQVAASNTNDGAHAQFHNQAALAADKSENKGQECLSNEGLARQRSQLVWGMQALASALG
ncbi:MAG: hypothetical protein HYZ45_00845 [Burkholderiales bacterium]|nr:hypothetical protein [Burkholderiales bacterium]